MARPTGATSTRRRRRRGVLVRAHDFGPGRDCGSVGYPLAACAPFSRGGVQGRSPSRVPDEGARAVPSACLSFRSRWTDSNGTGSLFESSLSRAADPNPTASFFPSSLGLQTTSAGLILAGPRLCLSLEPRPEGRGFRLLYVIRTGDPDEEPSRGPAGTGPATDTVGHRPLKQ